ncbi:MAG: DUF4097 family beta strand repeat-containing protein [Terriglobales bacterium]
MSLPKLALLLSAALALTAMPAALSAQSGSFHRQFQVNGPVTLVIHNGSGDVRVSAIPGRSVTVDATIKEHFGFFTGADPRDIQNIENHPPLSQSGNTIRIDKIQAGWFHNISIRYVITAPADTEVRAETGSGDIDLDGLRRNTRLDTGSGDVHIAGLRGDVHASTGSGDIRIGRIDGSADFSTGSGDISGDAVSGHLRASTGSGDIRVDQIGQGAYAGTGSGEVTLGEVSGNVTAHSGSGDISIGGVLSGSERWDLGSGSGEIHVALSANSQAQARLSADSGDISVRLPSRDSSSGRHSWTGIIGTGTGSPAATLVAHADSGDVVVH